MKDIFISYKAEQIQTANWVKAQLESNGLGCWMAPGDIPGGSNYAAEIPQAIRQCKIFVLLLSSQAQTSPWVAREVDLALNERKVVMPFMLEDCVLQDDFNFYLTNVQRYAAYQGKESVMQKMIQDIKTVLKSVPSDASGEDLKQEEASPWLHPEDLLPPKSVPAPAPKKSVIGKVFALLGLILGMVILLLFLTVALGVVGLVIGLLMAGCSIFLYLRQLKKRKKASKTR